MADCTKVDCAVKVFDVIASLYVNTYRYDYSDILNGRIDGGGTIDDTIVGCCFAEAYDLETIVTDICTIYKIERTFTETQLRLYRNDNDEAATVVATIKANELAVTNTSANGVNFEISTTYNSATNSVTQLAFNFLDADNDYKPNQLTAKRPDAVQTDPVKQISLPFVMHLSDAETLVNRLLGDTRLNRISHAFRLPPKYAWIGKGDVLVIDHGEFSDTVRVVDIDFNADKSQSVTGQTVATKQVEITTTPHASTVTKISNEIVDSLAVVLDVPLFVRTEGTAAGVFEMAYSVIPSKVGSWLGGYLTRKFAGEGVPYLTLLQNYGKPGTVLIQAHATNALTDKRWVTDSDVLNLGAFTGEWDTSNNTNKATIDATELKNMAVYGAPGRWEIIQFEAIVSGVMSGIVRGLRGTEIHCGKHVAGDIVMPIVPGVLLMRIDVAHLGEVATYRPISEGQQFISGTSTDAPVFEGNSRRPFAPYHFTGTRGSDGAITIAWLRRDRAALGWGQPLANSESMLAFSVDVCTPAGAVLRTLAATDTSVVYSSDAQSADGMSGASSFLIKAKQIGDIGAGFEGTGTINV